MELMLDTINLTKIKEFIEVLPIVGITSNPSIVKEENCGDFFEHMLKIREVIGLERSLHIQVVAEDVAGQLAEAEEILKRIDDQVYIKIPVNKVGLKTITALKRKGVNVTATAIYSEFQAYMAIIAGADFVAPYYNRMANQNIDSKNVVKNIATMLKATNSPCQILGASYKNTQQVCETYVNGGSVVTISPDLIETGLGLASIKTAISDFSDDWEALYQKRTLL